jgi:UDP-N-acetyl-D-galactosamine dehydrogenase
MQQRKISVVGLGYVGLPLAIALSKTHQVLGFDVNQQRITELAQGQDKNDDVCVEELTQANLQFTAQVEDLAAADFHIIAVPTPITAAKQPDLNLLCKASASIGQVLKPGDIVVYESTVYPGVTEEECVPVLEQTSGLVCGKDFFVGYSPERINPGDSEHSLTKMVKVVSAQDADTLATVAAVYESVVEAGVFRASSIKVAEAAKVIENTQRDLNIALVNEFAKIFHKLDIDTQEVLAAAGTKWNFLPFKPGLVGGHCIGVDPYYLTYKAKEVGYHPEVILSGRHINDDMGRYVAENVIKQMIRLKINIAHSRVAVCGLTFKENCADLRNTRVVDIVEELTSYGIEVIVHDPIAHAEDAQQEYGLGLTAWDAIDNIDALIFAVGHSFYQQVSTQEVIAKLPKVGLVADIKGLFTAEDFAQTGLSYWRL